MEKKAKGNPEITPWTTESCQSCLLFAGYCILFPLVISSPLFLLLWLGLAIEPGIAVLVSVVLTFSLISLAELLFGAFGLVRKCFKPEGKDKK